MLPYNFSLSDRRQFLKLVLGIFSYSLGTEVTAENNQSSYFAWLNLANGESLFPPGGNLAKGPPGSLMKLVATCATLELRLPAAVKTIECCGHILVNGRQYSCRFSHGRVNITEALGQSCNVFFARAAEDLSLSTFLRYLSVFGIDSISSRQKQVQDQHNQSSLDYVLGLAGGFELTACQILNLVAIIAFRGKMIVLPKAESQEQQSLISPAEISQHTWNVLAEGMKAAGRSGTAKYLDPENKLHLAVKTGTSVRGKKFQSWLAGYFPYDAPRYAFCLRAFSGTSYDQAVPLARHFLFSKSWG